VFQRPRKPKSAPEKSAAEVWNEAVEAVAQHLETGVTHYTWNGNARRPNNYRAAAADARTTPNPYGDQKVPARESEEWRVLVEATSELGKAVALWQNARDAYVEKYPKEKQ
jgi:hypothetical protein